MKKYKKESLKEWKERQENPYPVWRGTYQEFLKDPKVCNYCGRPFDDKYTKHSVCGLE